MRKIIAVLMLGGLLTEVGRADDVPTATPPASFVDSDVVKDWHGSFAVGLNIAKGNSDTLLFNAAADAGKEWKKDEWKLSAAYAYGLNDFGRSNETKSINNLQGAVDYRHLFGERLYGGLGLIALHDDIADVSYRFILSPTVGYYFIKSPETRLRGEVGPAYLAERVGSGANSEDQSFITLRVGERFEHDFNKTAKMWQQIDYFPHVGDFGNYLLNFEIGAEAALNSRFSLRVVGQDKYNSVPPPGRKSNDLAILASVVYKFGK